MKRLAMIGTLSLSCQAQPGPGRMPWPPYKIIHGGPAKTNYTVSWPAVIPSGKGVQVAYVVQASPDLIHWTNRAVTSGTNVAGCVTQAPALFFRVGAYAKNFPGSKTNWSSRP